MNAREGRLGRINLTISRSGHPIKNRNARQGPAKVALQYMRAAAQLVS